MQGVRKLWRSKMCLKDEGEEVMGRSWKDQWRMHDVAFCNGGDTG